MTHSTQCLARTRWPLLCIAAVLLAIAGCSRYEPRISTATKAAVGLTHAQAIEKRLACQNDYEQLLLSVKNSKTAKEAADKLPELNERLKDAYVLSLDRRPPRKSQRGASLTDGQYRVKLDDSKAKLDAAVHDLAKVRDLPADFLGNGRKGEEGRSEGRRGRPDIARMSPGVPRPIASLTARAGGCGSWPWSSSGAVCVGFLFRDGLWSNAIRLVNVVFAGLLAMNFYEWLARWLTNYSERLHPYVAFFDFLALWTCFIVFMVVFRTVTDAVSRVRVRFLKVVDLWGGVVLSLCIGWVMVGFTLTTLHAAPLGQYPLLGSFQPQNSMFLGMFAPDREWLGFTKYQSSGPFCRSVGKEQSSSASSPPTSSRSNSNGGCTSRSTSPATPTTPSASISKMHGSRPARRRRNNGT